MRPIKFRGKNLDNNEWHYGCGVSVAGDGTTYIMYGWGQFVTVAPDSVGEFTGITDKKHTEIYEGDIVKCIVGAESFTGVVRYGQYTNNDYDAPWDLGFYVDWEGVLADCLHPSLVAYLDRLEVVANEYDNAH